MVAGKKPGDKKQKSKTAGAATKDTGGAKLKRASLKVFLNPDPRYVLNFDQTSGGSHATA
jgi:hypothetical protein